jgi:hypothetical protein
MQAKDVFPEGHGVPVQGHQSRACKRTNCVQGPMLSAFCHCSKDDPIQHQAKRTRTSGSGFAEVAGFNPAYRLEICGEIPEVVTQKMPLWKASDRYPTVVMRCEVCNKLVHPRANIQWGPIFVRIDALWLDVGNRPCEEWSDKQLKISPQGPPALALSSANRLVSGIHQPAGRATEGPDLSIWIPAACGWETALPDLQVIENAGRLSILNKEGIDHTSHQAGSSKRDCNTKRRTAGYSKNKELVLAARLYRWIEGKGTIYHLIKGKYERIPNVKGCISNPFTVQNQRSTCKTRTGADVIKTVNKALLIKLFKQSVKGCKNSSKSLGGQRPSGHHNSFSGGHTSSRYWVALFSLSELQAAIVRFALKHSAVPDPAARKLRKMMTGRQPMLSTIYRSDGPFGVVGEFGERVVAAALGGDGSETVLMVSHVNSTPLGAMLELAHELVQQASLEGSCFWHPLMVGGTESQQLMQPYEVYATGRTSYVDAWPLKPRQGQPLSSGLELLGTLAELWKLLRDSGVQLGSFSPYARLCSWHFLKTLGVQIKKPVLRGQDTFFLRALPENYYYYVLQTFVS